MRFAVTLLSTIMLLGSTGLADSGQRRRAPVGADRASFNPVAEWGKAMQLGLFFNRRMTEMGLDAAKAGSRIYFDTARSWLDVMAGKKTLDAHVGELSRRTASGLRYPALINRLGRQLFGSAKFKGERVIAENDLFRLSYIPAKAGAPKQQAAVFHVGGFLPFGDGIFRFLPEANLFKPLVERGMPVYAMELKGGAKQEQKLRNFTLDQLIDTIDQLSDKAFAHHGKRKLVLEGYCGIGMQALSYLAAKPRSADAKFSVAATMVAPVDGRACKALDKLVSITPEALRQGGRALAKARGFVGGEQTGTAIGFALGGLFAKTPAGLVTNGYRRGSYANVTRVADLDPRQRQELAGAYWLSNESAARSPMPLALADFAQGLWRPGPTGGKLAARYKGKQLDLKTIGTETRIKVVGFYGGTDPIVPEATARPLAEALGKRYTHVVHPNAGHIAYIMSPDKWDKANADAFKPNPADVILGLYRDK